MGTEPDTRAAGPNRRRFWVVAAVVVVLAGAAWAVFGRREHVRPEDELAAATDALRRHDPSAARTHLDRVLAEYPTDARALLLSAQAARRANACADSERFLTQLDAGREPAIASQHEWTLLGVQQGDFGDAEPRLQRAVDGRDPSTPEILEAMARGYEATYRFPEALLVLDALLKLESNHVPARVVRGRVRARLRQLDGAEEDLRTAVKRAPDDADAQLTLAALLNRRGHTREAILHYEIGRRVRPNDVAARLGLARALADAADLPGAERTLDELLADEPTNPDVLADRARLLLRQKRPADAEPFLARAVATAPWHRAAHRLHLIALTDLGRSADAVRAKARLAELTATDGEGGRLKLRARDNAGDVAARWELWLWSQRNGEFEEGFAWLTEVLRADPKHAAARAAMADYFGKAGQPRRAAMHRGEGPSPRSGG